MNVVNAQRGRIENSAGRDIRGWVGISGVVADDRIKEELSKLFPWQKQKLKSGYKVLEVKVIKQCI